jgi:hypothetical protein
MKKIIFILSIVLVLVSCKNNKTSNEAVDLAVNSKPIQDKYNSFGDAITDLNVLTQNQISETYKNLKSGDTLNVKFQAEVSSVCQAKGCWMRVNVGEEEAMIKFKDYAFFMPKDIAGQEVIIEGKAFVAELSVDEQRHYAEDGGSTKEEIMAITAPKRTLSFESSGVLIPVAKTE